MFSAVYFESEVREHPRARAILERYCDLPHIECGRASQIFNRKAQNFRMQKQYPALILARKHGRKVLPAPGGYGFAAEQSHYFSHMLNCIYDCRYCFLQGMYRSAHCLLFVNFEDFAESISEHIAAGSGRRGLRNVGDRPDPMGEPDRNIGKQVFYSGYNCDSLALEPVSKFAEFFVPFFARQPAATLELRTKSTQISSLLQMAPTPNCIIAMSFTTEAAAKRWEHDVPSIAKRLAALSRLQKAGWPVALRFEPLLPGTDPQACAALFDQVFSRLDADRLHSVSTGLFRMPAGYYRNTLKLYPDEPLFACETQTENGIVSFKQPDREAWLGEIETILFGHINPAGYYRCAE